MPEANLLERCRRGDTAARRELFEGTSERIYRLLLRMTQSPEDADDLTQETYLKAFAQLDRFAGRSSIATWLYRIAVNEALQFLRRRKTLRGKLSILAIDRPNECRDEDVGRRLDVKAALSAMTPSDRAMLLLRYQEGLSYRTIAEVTGCAEGTIASRLSRARDRMREFLQDSDTTRENANDRVHPNTGR